MVLECTRNHVCEQTGLKVELKNDILAFSMTMPSQINICVQPSYWILFSFSFFFFFLILEGIFSITSHSFCSLRTCLLNWTLHQELCYWRHSGNRKSCCLHDQTCNQSLFNLSQEYIIYVTLSNPFPGSQPPFEPLPMYIINLQLIC